MLQAKSCYRAGLYENCLTILASEKSSEANHLRARCYMRLKRLDEAIKSLKAITSIEPNSPLGVRAAKDLEFAIWMKAAGEQLLTEDEDKN